MDFPFENCKGCDWFDGVECDFCIDGRDMEVVNEYASSCDGCGELTMHENQTMNDDDQLGYCDECLEIMTA